jgi:hypothetical protein
MIMALRTLHGRSQEDFCRLCRGLHAIVGELFDQKIHSAVKTFIPRGRAPCCRNQFLSDLVVGLVREELCGQVITHALPISERSRHPTTGSANERVGPHRRPMVHVVCRVLRPQEPVD